MIYLDSSVALAKLFGEDRRPPDGLWDLMLASSRLLQYEIWSRIHARRLASTHAEFVRELLEHVDFLDLSAAVLERALEPFPTPVRTLDALHLASAHYLRQHGQPVEIASYDARFNAAATALGFPLFPL